VKLRGRIRAEGNPHRRRKLADAGTIALGGAGGERYVTTRRRCAIKALGSARPVEGPLVQRRGAGINVMHLEAVERDAWEQGLAAGEAEASSAAKQRSRRRNELDINMPR
jgi:hypothetical protein